MKLWLRAIDENGESMCKPILVNGTVIEGVEGRPYFDVKPLERGSRKMRGLTNGYVDRFMYVDPKTGQPLPSECAPSYLTKRYVTQTRSLSLNASRLSVYLPAGTPIERTGKVVSDEQQVIENALVELAAELSPVRPTPPPWAPPTPSSTLVSASQAIALAPADFQGWSSYAYQNPRVPPAATVVAQALDDRVVATMREVGLPTYVTDDDGNIVPAPR